MKKTKNNSLLKVSVFISIAIHVIAIASINRLEIRSYLATNNILFSNKTEVIPFNKNKPKEIVQVIQQPKPKSIIKNTQLQTLYTPGKENTKKLKNSYSLQVSSAKNKEFHFQIIEKKKPVELIDSSTITLPKIEVEEKEIQIPHINIEGIAKEKYANSPNNTDLPKYELDQKINIKSKKELFNNYQTLARFKFSSPVLESDQDLIDNLNKFKQQKIKLFPRTFSIIDMPELNDLTTLSYKDFFNIEVTFAPRQDESGFIFAITLIPKPSIRINRLKQNIFFLVDRSNSIQKERLTATRHAVTSALSSLDKDDSFNILAFDSKLDVLSNNNLNPDNLSLSRAKGFLRRQDIGSFFSSTNFSIPFFKILNNSVKKDEINIAILLSNGDGLNKFKNYRIINEWTRVNGGNLALYSIGLNEDKNSSILELFSFLNKGKSFSSTTNRGIKRKLQKLLKSLDYPIAKDIVTNTICLDTSTNIKIYPPTNQAPHLYLNEPYVILGTIDKIQDFTIFVQGKNKDKCFNLKKHICFDEAKQGGKELQKQLAIKQASLCYEKYLADNNPYHLQEASNHLEPFEIKPTFR